MASMDWPDYSSHFGINNLPYGIASISGPDGRLVKGPAPATRLHDNVFFLAELTLENLDLEIRKTFSEQTLNALAALPKAQLRELRATLQQCLRGADGAANCPSYESRAVRMHLPFAISDFTDFSCSMEHQLNAGEAMMGKRELPPGAKANPTGYNGRCSSVVVSPGPGNPGQAPVVRPRGNYWLPGDEQVAFGPSQMMDYELEMACIIGRPTELGKPVSMEDADDHIFGVVLLNDWSARDIQKFEMRPLGPLNGKSFATTISPWVVTTDALESFRARPPSRMPGLEVMEYLRDGQEDGAYNIALEARLDRGGKTHMLCQANLSWMYWTFRHLVAHQTVNGCSLNTGDVLATGTVSGTGPGKNGCLLELSRKGQFGGAMLDGHEVTWLQDDDVVRLSGLAGPGVGFGECVGVLKANPYV